MAEDFGTEYNRLEQTVGEVAGKRATKGNGLGKKLLLGASVLGLVGTAVLGSIGGKTSSDYDKLQGQVDSQGEILVKFDHEMHVGAEANGNVVTGLPGVDAINRGMLGESYTQLAPSSPEYTLDNWYIVNVPDGMNLGQLMSQLAAQPGVNHVESNYLVTVDPYQVVGFVSDSDLLRNAADPSAKKPNDPFYSSKDSWGKGMEDLYGLYRTDAEGAWKVTTGSDKVIIAVVDTGVDWKHPDIAKRVIHNAGEIAGDGIDNDHNGYIDDVVGYDFVNKDGDAYDDQGHGTHVSGTIAADTNNGIGIAGVTWQGRILPVKVLDSNGSGSWSTVAQGIVYAAKNNADVINMSLGGRASPNQKIVDEAIAYADSKGTIVVVAAGNSNGDTMGHSPANNPLVIAIAATDPNDRRASFSNWGKKVDVAAPGTEVLSLLAADHKFGNRAPIVGEQYVVLAGTSMATPHVTGEVALILAANPELRGQREAVRAILRGAVDPYESDQYIGTGRVNFAKAVAAAVKYDLSPLDSLDGMFHLR